VNALCHPRTLGQPAYENTFSLYCDASECAIGGVLVQNSFPVHYVSRVFNSAERGYSMPEKEMLAVLYCLSKLVRYLVRVTVTVFCDNSAAVQIFRKSSMEVNKRIRNRVLFWKQFVDEFDIEWKDIRTHDNAVADLLSRPLAIEVESSEDEVNVALIESEEHTESVSEDVMIVTNIAYRADKFR